MSYGHRFRSPEKPRHPYTEAPKITRAEPGDSGSGLRASGFLGFRGLGFRVLRFSASRFLGFRGLGFRVLRFRAQGFWGLGV